MTVKDLAEMARKHGLDGWKSMKKDQLVRALLRASRRATPSRSSTSRRSTSTAPARRAATPAPRRTVAPSRTKHQPVTKTKAIATKSTAPKAKSNRPAPAPTTKRIETKSVIVKAAASKSKSPDRALTNSQSAAKAGTPVLAKDLSPKKDLAKPLGPPARNSVVIKSPPVVVPPPVAPKPVAAKPVLPDRPPTPTRVLKKIEAVRDERQRLKHINNLPADRDHAGHKDRLVLMVRDPYWLHACWHLSRHGVERARAAMAQDWHSARPVLRLYEVSQNASSPTAERIVRDIEIHGGVSNWYIDIKDPPRSYRLDVGYVAPNGKLFVLARSNVVTPPKPGSCDSIDEHWTDVAKNSDKIYALSGGSAGEGVVTELQELFEERLRRPMGAPLISRFGPATEGLGVRRRDLEFEIDADMIVYGQTEPDAAVTLSGEPIKLRPDGTFTVRVALPNARQVLPAVASSADGLQQRTVVLAVERNTKVMEPVSKDAND
jgi:hypothetical protein